MRAEAPNPLPDVAVECSDPASKTQPRCRRTGPGLKAINEQLDKQATKRTQSNMPAIRKGGKEPIVRKPFPFPLALFEGVSDRPQPTPLFYRLCGSSHLIQQPSDGVGQLRFHTASFPFGHADVAVFVAIRTQPWLSRGSGLL